MLQKDKCKIQPGICRISETGKVVFDDHSEFHYDFIVMATGYQPPQFRFLPKQYQTSCLEDRFLGVFHPDVNTMAFIGFMRGNVGSLVLGFEMQARWFALLCSGRRQLPDAVGVARRRNQCYNGTTGTWFYAITWLETTSGASRTLSDSFAHIP